ncbi:CU044_5270 family protein [Longispora sp. K20-0274]|uniref:CU044_5270 family protein n=1 Tax=Longispora sp. K20-0274 TaxID=3088255 RepID=UPI00399A9E40
MTGHDDLETLRRIARQATPAGLTLPAEVHARARAVIADGTRLRAARRGRHRRITMGALAVAGVIAVLAGVVAVVRPFAGAPGPSPSPLPRAGREVLFVLAAANFTASGVADTPPRRDQFVLTVAKVWYPGPGGGALSEVATWTSVDGEHHGLRRVTIPGGPIQPDRTIPGCQGGRMPALTHDGQLDPGHTTACKPEPAYRDDLPTTATAMLDYLRHGTAGDGAAFARARGLLTGTVLPPAAQRALFEAVALIPGVAVDRDVTDITDRKVVAVTCPAGDDGTRYEMLFDPDTLAYRGWQTRTGSGHVDLESRPSALVRTAVVDRPGDGV